MSIATSIALALAAYAVLTLLLLALRRLRLVRQIFISLNLLFLCGAVSLFLTDELEQLHTTLADGVKAAFLCLTAYVVIRLLDVWLFDVVIQRRRRKQIPVVVRDIIRWIVIATAFFLILRIIFPDLNLSILAFSSLVMGYIVGNATQDTLGNLIAGLALNTENPFAIGDWVMVGGNTGRIVEMTWRATRLRTKMNDHVVIPNSTIAREPIVNYSRPTTRHGFTLEVGVSYEVAPNTVRRVILDVLDSVPAVLTDPRPRVWLTNYGDFSIDYTIKFFITDFEHLEDTMSDVMYLIWYHFKRAGIVIPFPIRDVRISRGEEPTEAIAPEAPDTGEHFTILRGIHLFAPIGDEELHVVAGQLREQVYAAGEALVRQGEEGESFFVIRSGTVRVVVTSGGRESILSRLQAGDFFGEMSLLTGAERSASVIADTDTRVLVLSHEILHQLLDNNPTLAEDLARQLAKRQDEKRALLDAQARAAVTTAVRPEPRSELVERIKRFFGLGH